MNRYGMRVNG